MCIYIHTYEDIPLERLGLDVGRGQDERRVARVHAALLDVLGDGIGEDYPLIGNRINVYLLSALQKL